MGNGLCYPSYRVMDNNVADIPQELREREEHDRNMQKLQEAPDAEILGDAYKYDPEYHRLCDFLGVDRDTRSDYDVAKKISLIADWGKKMAGNTNDGVEIRGEIKSLQRRLGISLQGKTLVNKLYQWVRLDMDRRRIEKEMSLLVNTGEE